MTTTVSQEGDDDTISGLLRRRAELIGQARRLRDRIAEIRNDVEAMDGTLRALGYKGEPRRGGAPPEARGDLRPGQARGRLMREPRDADGPMTSRGNANGILALGSDDVRDRRLHTEVTRRVSNALCHQRKEGPVRSSADRLGNGLWSRRVGRSEVVGDTCEG